MIIMPRKPYFNNLSLAEKYMLSHSHRKGSPYIARPQPGWLTKYLAGIMPKGIVFRNAMGKLRFRSMRNVNEDTIDEIESFGNTVVYVSAWYHEQVVPRF
jgi:hypothetical protein